MDYVFFALGFVLLLAGGEAVIRGGTAVARKLGTPEIVVGLTLVSIGTSLPELLVNLIASFNGNSELAVGNVLGSNVANILLILGVAACVRALPIHDTTIYSEIPFSLTATLLVGFLANAQIFAEKGGLSISRLDGAILLGFFLLFLAYIYRVWGASHASLSGDGAESDSLVVPVLWIVGGSLSLGLGAHWVVSGAINVSQQFGLSESFVGLTVVAIGTSLPELVTSVMAARRGNTDLAIGNAIGSNIFNLLWVLGMSAALRPLPFDVVSNLDIMMVIASSAMLLLAVAAGQRTEIDRRSGITFVAFYVLYLGFVTVRG
jgi:cation:H+ antiporter